MTPTSMIFARHPVNMTTEQVYRRAGGRRRYNAQRYWDAELRRLRVRRLLLDSGNWIGGWVRHGALAEIARRLGVSRSTICRDMQRIQADCHERGFCPVCGTEFDVGERRQGLDEIPERQALNETMPSELPEAKEGEQQAERVRQMVRDGMPCEPLPQYDLVREAELELARLRVRAGKDR